MRAESHATGGCKCLQFHNHNMKASSPDAMHEREILMEQVATPSVLSTVGPGRMRMSGSKEHWGTHPAMPAPPMHLCEGTCANRYALDITFGGVEQSDSTQIWHFVLKVCTLHHRSCHAKPSRVRDACSGAHLQVESGLLLAHATAEKVDARHGWGDAAQHRAHRVLGHLLRGRRCHIQACSNKTSSGLCELRSLSGILHGVQGSYTVQQWAHSEGFRYIKRW